MKHLKITYNGFTYEVDVEETGAVSSISPACAAPIPAAPAPVPAPPPVPQGGNVVEAPMSGRIAKILVQVGDTVRADDLVVILEAMKLENEIYADYDGVVREIRVKQNQVVNTEDVIAVIG